ncbi:aminopeptidase [Alkalibacter mobilis]|uniref:aminopeptidase n=1 Tax=Alkalibacter mobilis TaxID=2787712 RepID=UPI00189DED75|nr:aminopeptidase [Alkalibacter mobilis]MBF7096170.1 aminopeptidase [Alkalibacter mobilis]
MDERIKKLAHNLVNYSCEVKEGEKVLIWVNGESAKPLVRQLVKEVHAKGGYPFVSIVDSSINRELLLDAKEEQLKILNDYELYQMKMMDAYIGVRASDNITELADVPADKMAMYSKLTRPVTDERVNNTKWVVLRYPNASMAQLAGSSIESFEDFYFKVCNLDYNKMSKAMDPLLEMMNETDKVRITGPGTDLEFSIKDIPAVKCDGKLNIPDGEVYAAPVKDSVNGVLSYNAPSQYQGFTYENVKFTFKDGKIIEATANNTEKINQVLDTDEGARYIGEFAIGVNPYILGPMNDILFDEKIMGSFHFTPGMCYEDASNGNQSAVHWDLVCIQTKEYGGGEIYFDDVLIRKDGYFVHPRLEGLNPENLV